MKTTFLKEAMTSSTSEAFLDESNHHEVQEPRRGVPQHQKMITAEEMKRGIYIDFEGIPTRSPSLMGVLCQGKMKQIVFDEDLISTTAGNPNLSFEGFSEALLDLQRQALREGRCLIAFSQHESNLALEFGGVDISLLYKDARFIAKRWRNRILRLNDTSIRSLKDYANLIGLNYPEGMIGMAARSLQNIKKSIGEHENFQNCPMETKMCWSRLLHYNRLDCIWMREVVRASVEIDSLQKLAARNRVQRSLH